MDNQSSLPGMSQVELDRDPDTRLRVLCATNPIIRQHVQGSLYAAISPHYDHNVVVWMRDDAISDRTKAHLTILDATDGSRLGFTQTERTVEAIKIALGEEPPF